MADTDTPDARDDEDLIVKLDEDEAGDKDKDKGKPEAKLAPVPGPGTQKTAPVDGLKDLESQLVSERSARARAEEAARAATAERNQAVGVARDAQLRGASQREVAIDNQITNCTNEIDRLTEAAESAYENGDFKKVTECNRKIATLGGDLAVFKRDKQWAANQVAQHKQPQPGTRQPTEDQPTDPFEAAIKHRTAPVQEFLRKHRELVRSDGTLKKTAVDAHEAALDAGHKMDTPSYFEHIEGTLKGVGGEQRQEPARTEGGFSAAPERNEPLGRQPVNGVSANGEFKMTPKYLRLASEQGVTPTEWAKNYVKLLKEGRMQPIPPT